MPARHISALSGDLVHFQHVGIFVRAGFNEDDNERPYVSIDTSEMKPAFTYDPMTGLRGDAEPFTARQNGDCWEVVKEWSDKTEVVACFPGNGATPRDDAKAYAKARNETWHESVGMPIIAVRLNNDAEIYDDNGEGNTSHVWAPKAKLDALEEIIADVKSGAWDNEELRGAISATVERLEVA